MAQAAAARPTEQTGYQLLGVYLNDHLAGATAGTELARRMVKTHLREEEADGLRRFAAEVVQDRAALVGMMSALGIPVRFYKVGAAWFGEKAGRLKFNRHLFTRSPLSFLEEVEMMRLGVEGKAAGWRTLRTLAGADSRLDPARLDELIARAQRQSQMLEDLRISAASRVIDLESRPG